MESLNRMALELVDEAIDFADELNVAAYELDNEATVLDFGVEENGGMEAGLLLAELQTAGLATIQTRMGDVAGAPIPHVELSTDHPAVALLCSQKAGWELGVEGFEGLGSGPARALVAEEDEYRRVGYTDAFDFAVLAVESDTLPTEDVAEHVADLAEVKPNSVYLPTFATGSMAGSITVASRAAELAVFRLTELGYDPLDIRSAMGSAPVAPVSYDEATAIGRTNDALAYGGKVHLTVAEEFDRFDELPSSASEEYGTTFETFFDDADWNFEEIPESVFAPAQVTVDVVNGPTHVLGETNDDLLKTSFDL
ncbi:methenyltetrahydromethanopterin cyclohydrolase [Haladaptatus paucihalophilus DX253]|uniref:Methenyltetrahydromethanopterin cyclohydrolase n=1 Tax=Haladaptatus paucihalophilus DX253 TaxID=797209 RepID=E7QZW0_HALPU|nr:methenyltetrahydromethanopterin cyclohydrolase [Haladaptatus paucihalophilus]EFW89854.1 methenyltetrahydromethanopterin cyclohydrolase [Haladaptatus paucihalophilus DX253]SHK56225.1 methenyltetrahydromethanopterin cyclohydrolase [Haladaptatus paucihalophilus DX253]